MENGQSALWDFFVRAICLENSQLDMLLYHDDNVQMSYFVENKICYF